MGEITSIEQLTLDICLDKNLSNSVDLLTQWDDQINIDLMPYSVMRLTPLLLTKFQSAGVVSKYDKRLNVLYKYWWLHYQQKADLIKHCYEQLKDNDIQSVVIKGMGLVDYYTNPIHRTMADFDLLVYREKFEQAADLFLCDGWEFEYQEQFKMYFQQRQQFYIIYHALALVHKISKTKLDLHFRIGSYTTDTVTQKVWKELTPSKSFKFIQKPQNYIELYLVVVHAVMSNFNDNITWLIDLKQMESSLSEDIWEKALELSTQDFKEEFFLYGCYLAKQNGIVVKLFTPIENMPPLGTLDNNSNKGSVRWALRGIKNTYAIVRLRHKDKRIYKQWLVFIKLVYFKIILMMHK